MSPQRVLLSYFLLWQIRRTLGSDCGRALGVPDLQGKIVGGYDVGYYKYPWFASLLLDGQPWCGGTLIGPKTVVTAAHCFKQYLVQPNADLSRIYTVKLGLYNWCHNESSAKEYHVKKVDVHENYMKKKPYYDICLLTLNRNAEEYTPACLPPASLDDRTRGREAVIIGLGTAKYGADKYPCSMHEGRVLIYKDKTCKSMIKNATQDKEDYPMTNAFCAGYMEGGVDACQGDSGGPIMSMGHNGRYSIIGLTSFGYDCAKKDLLGIYTDVSHYLGWIKEKSGIESQAAAITTSKPDAEVKPTSSDNVTIDISDGAPNVTEFPVFPWVAPTTKRPPFVYTTHRRPNRYWHPKKIIIEFRKKRKHHHKHKKHNSN
ncbi:PREDICTED: trypsin-like [Nicrophorus vespilloides]|uniref:Trypsin-like n=1 Tax=Nicrophorus vespilloides TaxID=110193 RepID=A0ABM1MFJ8_NICVS|nr:PREDICTED: trypsin-like [Nicrophorus vespilloides]